jgi:cytoskeletal protein CcmA (bactofilin family)
MDQDKDKNPPAEGENNPSDQQAPADALSKTPDELDDEKAANEAANPTPKVDVPGEKKISPIKKFFRKVNLYFLLFILVIVISGIVLAVNYLNSQQAPVLPDIASQSLTQDALKQLANTDATVGNTSQTLTIQGNAVIAGQTLMRGNLNVAGNLQTGGSITAPNITISGTSNLGTTQINDLQVAQNAAVQGTTTLRDLNVSGASSFSGPITASQITVTRLVLSGNGVLQVPNHLSFTGATPGRSVNGGVVGNGGSLSVSGSDTSGTINVNTGNNPTSGCFGRVNFTRAYTATPKVIVSPVGSGAGQTQFYVERNTSGFNICTTNTPPSNAAFSYDFFVAG